MKTVLITGGSSGIGFEFSKKFLKDGYRLLWVAIDEDELQKSREQLLVTFPESKIDILAVDLISTGAQSQVIEWQEGITPHLDVLINNAGIGVYGYVSDTDLSSEVNMVQLNVVNSMILTKLVLQKMKKRDQGTIINICSSSAFQPVPKLAAYAATKSFLSSYSLAIADELKQQNSKVRIISVYPAGIKDTSFASRGNMENVRIFHSILTTTVAEVAEDVWSAFQSKKSVVITGAMLRRIHWMRKILPESIVKFIVKMELRELS